MNRLFALLFVLVISTSFVIADPQLGEGCGSGEFFVGCDTDCSWNCEEGKLVKRCSTAHGWCQDGNSCVPCDFIAYNSLCGTQECSGLDGVVPGTAACTGYYEGSGVNDIRNAFLTQTYETYNCPAGETACVVTENGKERVFLSEEDGDSDGLFDVLRPQPPSGTPHTQCTGAECIEVDWVLDVDGDNYYSLSWANISEEVSQSLTNAYPTNVISLPEGLCFPPTNIQEGIEGLTSNQQQEVAFALEYACAIGEGRDEECLIATNWVRKAATLGPEASCYPETYANTGSSCYFQDQNAQKTPTTLYCDDEDNDGYGTNCVQRSSLQVIGDKKADYELLGTTDCVDTGEEGGNVAGTIHPNTVWVLDEDTDGYWAESLVQCQKPGNAWQINTQQTLSQFYDCNDNDENITNPTNLVTAETTDGACSCQDDQLGKPLLNFTPFVCANTQNKTVIHTETAPTTYKKAVPSENKWLYAEQKADFTGRTEVCPVTMCAHDLLNLCVPANTFWPDNFYNNQPIRENVKGSNLCVLGKDGAFWTTRTAKINELLIKVGEGMETVAGEDVEYGVYCDNMYNIAQDVTSGGADIIGGIPAHLRELFFDEASIVDSLNRPALGNACILTVNEDYSTKIRNGGSLVGSQSIILALPFSGDIRTLSGGILGIDLGTDFAEQEWGEDWLRAESEGVYFHEPLQLLFIIQKQNEFSELKDGFELHVKPNDPLVQFLRYLRNPVLALSTLRGINDDDVTHFNPLLLNSFETSFLGKQDATYWYAVYQDNDITAKIVNPHYVAGRNDGFKDFLYRMCVSGTVKESSVSCVGFNGTPEGYDYEGLRDEVGIFIEDAPLSLWEDFSTGIRLQGNSATSSDTFFVDECTTDNVTEACPVPPDSCFVATCNDLYQCDYLPTGVSGNVIDGCCPAGATAAEDDDCAAESTYIPFEVNLRDACQTDEEYLLSLESNSSSLVSFQRFSGDVEVCLRSQTGEFNVTPSPSTCDIYGNEPVIAGTSRLNKTRVFDPSKDASNRLPDICIEHTAYNVTCEIAEYCPGYKEIISLTSPSNALAGKAGTHDINLCCVLYPDGQQPPDISQCTNNRDDDGDGLVDGDDPSCAYGTEFDTLLNPSIKSACSSGIETRVATLSSLTNAHIATADTYPFKLCIDGSFQVNTGATCTGNTLFSISGQANAHASGTSGSVDVCVQGPVPIQCMVGTVDACVGKESLFSVSSQQNAHVGDVGFYDLQVCCSTGEATNSLAQSQPQCSDGVDNDGDGFADEQDPNCVYDGDEIPELAGTYVPEHNDESQDISQAILIFLSIVPLN